MYHDSSVQAYSDSAYHSLGDRTYWFIVSRKLGAVTALLVLALGMSVFASHLPAESAMQAKSGSRMVFALAVLALGYAFLASGIVHKSRGFMLGTDALKIRRGVFHKEEFAIPYRQIQNIEIERSIRHQLFGLSSLIILTAGNENRHTDKDDPEGVIDFMDKEIASRLRDELLSRTNVQKVVDAQIKSHA